MKFLAKGSYIAILFLLVSGYLLFRTHESSAQTVTTDANLKVAFVGDDGNGENTRSVLNLAKTQRAAFVVDGGDLDYLNSPTAWDNLVTSVLGSSYPYFVAEGNHDIAQWPGYTQKLAARYGRFSGESCTGTIGIKQACTYRGVLMLLLAPGMTNAPSSAEYVTFIQQQLAASNAKWKVCVWHYPLYATTEGPAGSAVYEACRRGGAIIATAHSHLYDRTKTLTSIPNRTIDSVCPLPQLVCVALGKTFVFLSGLGGKSLQAQNKCASHTYPYGCRGEYAKMYNADNGSNFGALFIIFNYLGNPNRAHGYFKDIDGKNVDQFDIVLGQGPGIPTVPTFLEQNKTYKFINVGSGKALDYGTQLQIWTDNGTNPQKWIYSNDRFINVQSNKALDVPGASTTEGTKLQVYTPNTSRAQHWQVLKNADGTYTFLNPNSNYVMDVVQSGTANGTRVQLWKSNGTNAQKWKAVLITPPTATPRPTVLPTATPRPSPSPTRVPTPTLSGNNVTPTTIVTPVPTITSITPASGTTSIGLTLALHGVGSGDNPNPITSQRVVSVELYNSLNQLVLTKEGTVQYDSPSGKFKGTIGLGAIQAGFYTAKVKTSRYLRALIPGIQTFTNASVNTLPGVTLVAGDINGDNVINILDYTILMGCYSDLLPPTSCSGNNALLSDLNDDGKTNQYDYNYFIREIGSQQGE